MATSFTISAATGADYPAFARLFPELKVPEQTPSAERFAETIAPGAILLRDGGEVAGYAWARPRGDCLHVVHVIVDPSRRRRGAGRALMQALEARGREAGFRRWMLNVKPENAAARALYERCGMRVTLESASMRMPWASIERLEPSPGVLARPLPEEDDARFERALGLSGGEIAGFRALAGRLFFGAEQEGKAVGVAGFDPAFPGASPFCVSAPASARALLERCRSAALEGQAHLFVFVEGDPELARALEAAGAEPAMRVLRMTGELPPLAAPPGVAAALRVSPR